MRYAASVLVLLLVALQIPQAALAHNGPPRVELGAERIMPGVALEVRGVNIAPEQPVRLTLVGGGQEFPLGTFIGNEHGDFTEIVMVPRDAPAGAYVVRAIGPNRLILTVPLTIVGQAEQEEGQQREEEEPLLAPMPQGQPAAQAAPARASAPVAPQASRFPTWLALALAAIVAVAGLAILARRRVAGWLK